MPTKIYLDNHTISKPSERSLQKMLQYHTEKWGNPSAPHQMGQELLPALEDNYKSIYSLLGANENDEVLFTSSGAEAINHAIFSTYYDVMLDTGKNQFVTSNIDEAPSIMSIGRIEKMGCVGKMASAGKEGFVSPEAIADVITPRTAMVSLSWANGLTGVINPVHPISDLCQERGIRLHLDASYILGKLYFDLNDIRADFITFEGSRLHAPKGTGGLYIREGIKLSPFIVGGAEQGGRRAGTFDMAGFAALAQSAKETLECRDLLCTEVARLRNRLEQGIKDGFPDATIFFQDQERLPNTTAISFPGIANEAMLFALNRKGVFASIGGGHFQQIAIVLIASGIKETLANTALNFSLSRETNEAEIDKAIDIIVETAKKLSKVSFNKKI
jgi:cysteine desulfurase